MTNWLLILIFPYRVATVASPVFLQTPTSVRCGRWNFSRSLIRLIRLITFCGFKFFALAVGATAGRALSESRQLGLARRLHVFGLKVIPVSNLGANTASARRLTFYTKSFKLQLFSGVESCRGQCLGLEKINPLVPERPDKQVFFQIKLIEATLQLNCGFYFLHPGH